MRNMNKQTELQDVKVLLSRWIAEIGLDTELDFYDINKISEGFVAKLLNAIYNYELEDLNKIQSNFPTLDLGDTKGKIAIQVTSRIDFDKYKSTIESFVKEDKKGNSLAKIFTNGIRFFILTNKPIKWGRVELNTIYDQFDKQKHIISYLDLYKKVSSLYDVDNEKFKLIKTILNDEFGNRDVDKILKLLENDEVVIALENVWKDILDVKDFLHNELIEILSKGRSNFDEPGWNRIRMAWINTEKQRIIIPNHIFLDIKNLYESITVFFNNKFKPAVNNLTEQLKNSDLTNEQNGLKRKEIFENLIKNELWDPLNSQTEMIGKHINEYIDKNKSH